MGRRENRSNQVKHGVSFEEAETVFYDEYAWLEYDEHIVLKPDNKPNSRVFSIPFLVITLEETTEETKTFTIEYKKEKAR